MTKPQIRFRIDFGPHEAIGPGKVALLEQIAKSGSLSQAARELGMSYLRGWKLIESLNQSFRQPVTRASTGGKGGGGATLTPLAHEIIRSYREFESELNELAARHFNPLSGKVRVTRRATGAAKIRMSAR